MGVWTGWTGRKAAVMLVVAGALTGLGFAVRYGEDNQVGASNEVSWWVFVAAGLCAYWALLGFAIIALRYLKNRRK